MLKPIVQTVVINYGGDFGFWVGELTELDWAQASTDAFQHILTLFLPLSVKSLDCFLPSVGIFVFSTLICVLSQLKHAPNLFQCLLV